MNWSGKTVLVTGAGGFIGSHLTEHLVDLNANVKAFVRYNSRNDWGLLELLPKEKLDQIEVITAILGKILIPEKTINSGDPNESGNK